MKELDVLLKGFIDSNHERLERGGWPELESLLRVEDDVLWDWLQNPDLEPANDYRDLLRQLRRGP
jgi:succinate dehydrogenase flavin-adding protein (antitoxin of CptAB toxin-antitoxin module)